MLHTKFRGHRCTGSEEEDFYQYGPAGHLFTIYGPAGHLGHGDQHHVHGFSFPCT